MATTRTARSWRGAGFALHDRVSGFGDRLPLARARARSIRPASSPISRFTFSPCAKSTPHGPWSAGASVTHDQYRLKALYQPQTANPGLFDGEQYAWRTGYWALGASRTLGPMEFLAQGLDGETRMGLASGNRNAVIARFQAAYVLASWADAGSEASAHRALRRLPRARPRRFHGRGSNDESGTPGRSPTSSARPRHRITAELLRVDSTRTNRRDLGLDPARSRSWARSPGG